jgi:hypothetical protein
MTNWNSSWNEKIVKTIEYFDDLDLAVVGVKYVPPYAEATSGQPVLDALVITVIEKDRVKL